MKQLNSFSFSCYFFLAFLSTLLSASQQTFQFNKNGEYTILQFTDLHFCQDGPEKDLKSQELQRKILKWIKPDLVIFSGDAVSGWVAENAEEFEACYKQFIEPIAEVQLPYAYIFGNHDAEGPLNRHQVAKLDETYPFSVRKHVEGYEGKLDFIIPVYSSKDQNKLAANIWLFDTGSQSCDGFDSSSWGCMKRGALDWYNEKSQEIKEQHGTNIHHIAFLHIPIPEIIDLANTQRVYGVVGEQPNCPMVNNGFFDAVLKNQDISALFFGHDHVTNLGGYYQGIELAFGQKSGYAAYGVERGARVIKLKEEYDSKGELKVTRDHFVMFENGTFGLTHPTFPRGGEKLSCVYLGDGYIWKNIKLFYWNLKKWFWKLI